MQLVPLLLRLLCYIDTGGVYYTLRESWHKKIPACQMDSFYWSQAHSCWQLV